LNQIFGCIDHRSVGGLSGLSVPTPCQIECLFSSDCHFIVLVVSSACVIGNFQLTPVYMGYYFPRTVSIFKGKKEILKYLLKGILQIRQFWKCPARN